LNKLTGEQLTVATLLFLARGVMNYSVTAEELETNLTSTYDLISETGLSEEQKENIDKIVARANSLAKFGE